MQISVYLPLLLTALFSLSAPLLARWLAPALAVRALTAGAVVTAAASSWGLLLLALSVATGSPFARERGVSDPAPLTVGCLAAGLLAWGLLRVHRVLRVRRETARALELVCWLCDPGGELAVVVDDAPQAFAVPGRPGRVLVSTGLLNATSVPEQAVVLAHERAHLRLRHHRYQACVDVAAAVNPLVTPARSRVHFLIERWADESAAAGVRNRTRTAVTLARVALLTGTSTRPAFGPGSLAFHSENVVERVRALQRPPVRSRWTVALAAAVPVLLALTAEADATLAFGRLVGDLLASS